MRRGELKCAEFGQFLLATTDNFSVYETNFKWSSFFSDTNKSLFALG